MKTDTLFYRLFQDRPDLPFVLAGLPPPPPAAGYALRAEEIKETSFRLDGVLVPADPARYPLTFLEVQAQPDADVFAEGHEEGRHGEALALVRRLLFRRLGPLTGAAEERLAALSVAQLEDLGEALLDFARPSDLADWLRRGE